MVRAKRYQKRAVNLIAALLVLFAVNTSSYAQTASIKATAQVGVCGDSAKDTGEECDTSDFGNINCTTYGYDSGNLVCNIDCSINTAACTLISTEDNGSDPASERATASIADEQTVILRYIPILPSKLVRYDKDKNDKLDKKELVEMIRNWNEVWRTSPQNLESCDIDTNGECSVIDLSVLLYYARI